MPCEADRDYTLAIIAFKTYFQSDVYDILWETLDPMEKDRWWEVATTVTKYVR